MTLTVTMRTDRCCQPHQGAAIQHPCHTHIARISAKLSALRCLLPSVPVTMLNAWCPYSITLAQLPSSLFQPLLMRLCLGAVLATRRILRHCALSIQVTGVVRQV